jgi:diguanylate cyclase (GGDEF)-like protein/PAS domain S-box-containing protein
MWCHPATRCRLTALFPRTAPGGGQSPAERALASREDDSSAGVRDTGAISDDERAEVRDEAARQRDAAWMPKRGSESRQATEVRNKARARDRAARRRDVAADRRDRIAEASESVDPSQDWSPESRALSKRAARARRAAAANRRGSAQDRLASAADRADAGSARRRSSADRVASHAERAHAGLDRDRSSADRSASAAARDTATLERVRGARWRAALEQAPIGVVELDLDGRVVSANQKMARLLGYPVERLEGTTFASYVHPDERDASLTRTLLLARGEGKEDGVLRRLITAAGADLWVEGSAVLIDGFASGIDRIISYIVDVTAEQRHRQELAETNARFAALVEHSADAILIIDSSDGMVRYASPGLSAIIGRPAASVVGTSIRSLYHPDDVARTATIIDGLIAELGKVISFDCRLLHADGQWRHVEITSTNRMGDPAVRGIISNLREVTDRVEAASRLAHQAMHDGLTDLPNRALLLDRLGMALARASRSRRPCAALYVDLDRFKQINDTLGHAAGDQLLQAVAQRLQRAIRPGDSVARLGGDEFVVVSENIDDPTTAFLLAERIGAVVAEPVDLGDRTVTVPCSVGIALSHNHSAEGLLQEADMALYRAKESGRNRWELYDHAMRTQAHRRLNIEEVIRTALDERRLAVHYQPIIDLASGVIVGSEALARIDQPSGTTVLPADFIPVAEDCGLILPLGEAVLDLACAQQARWQASGSSRAHVAVNVSAHQLSSNDFVAQVSAAVKGYGLGPNTLCVELTESTLIGVGSSIQARLHELKALGVTLALDDFGTGWSSLSYLRRFPIDIVKIDQSFVSGLGTSSDDTEMVRAVIDLARALGLSTVAEGVETDIQDRLLRQLGCDHAQGFLYGKPEAAQ